MEDLVERERHFPRRKSPAEMWFKMHIVGCRMRVASKFDISVRSLFFGQQAWCAVGKIVVAIWFQQGCKTQSDGVCGFHNCSVPLD